MPTRLSLVVSLLWLSVSGSIQGQALGTFRWQLLPHCNLLTLSVRQDGGVYTLDGVDDQCGAAQGASVVGTAFLNPDGSIGMGLATVVSPGAAPVVLHARLTLATVSGTWSDSAGNGGTFAFTPGAPTPGGSGRPVPPNGIRPGSITSNQLAPGAVGAAQIALGAITSAQIAAGTITAAQLADGAVTAAKIAPGAVQVPIVGTCLVGQYLRGVSPNGAVICEPIFVPNLTTVADDPANPVGAFASMVLDSAGLPLISHREAGTANALRLTRCHTPACTSSTSLAIDDPADGVGSYSSIALGLDGLPVISHHNVAATALRVTKCGNPTCTAGNVSTNVDDPADAVGYFTSIEVPPDGLPLIAHLNYSTGNLRVTKCGNPSCTAGTSADIDDVADIVGWYASLAIGADGLPVIAHLNASNGTVRVTRCGTPGCTAGSVTTTVVDDPANAVGSDLSMTIGADGLPLIAYQEGTVLALRVTHCGDAACTSGNESTTIDDPINDVAYFTSIAIGADGRPIISHTEATTLALRVTKCGNLACSAGNVSTTVDDHPADVVGIYTATAIGLDGLPVIAHQNGPQGNLRVTKCGTQNCR